MISASSARLLAIGIFAMALIKSFAADPRLDTAIAFVQSLQTNQPFRLPPQQNEVENFRRWCAPILQTAGPAIEPLLHVVNTAGGEAGMLPALLISVNRWREGIEECFTLLDSPDERLRHAALDVINAVYADWEPATRAKYGKIDLPLVLQELRAKKGKLSIWVQQAISVSIFSSDVAGELFKPEWFDVPPSPHGFHTVNSGNIRDAVKHPSWNVRFASVEPALAAKQWLLAVSLLTDSDPRVALHCAELLLEPLEQAPRQRETFPPELTTECLRLNSHSDARIRAVGYEHAAALSQSLPSAIGPLFFLQGSEDKHPAVRQAAIKSWARSLRKTLNGSEAQRVLALATSDEDLGVRAAAVRLVQHRAPNNIRAQLKSWFASNQDPASRLLSQLGGGSSTPRNTERIGDRTFTLGTNNMILRAASGCVVQQTNNILMLSGEGQLSTEQKFTPPFTIRAVAQTDVTNIRLYWGTGVVIFNWELNPRELRFHDPEAGRVHAFGGRGFVTVNEWHEIEWVINPDSSHVIVDGDERAFVRSINTGLTNSVGIGAARGSIVSVKQLEVKKLKLAEQ